MWKRIALIVAALVAAFVLIVAAQPTAFRIQRSTVISAPPEIVFRYVNDFREWAKWNPFAKEDPTTKIVLSGPPAGTGAIYEWTGKKSGAGRMDIVESRPNQLVGIRLAFAAPMMVTNRAEFTLEPQPGGVKLTWAMSGENGFVGKAFSLVMNSDKMVGGEFEKGLADLKRNAEAEAAAKTATAR